MLKIISKIPTKEALALKEALEKRGVLVYKEQNDGHKTIDLVIPKARLDVEVDGIHHLTDPNQIVADLSRGYYSHKEGYDTMHIPNEMIRLHLDKISEALAEASKIKQRRIQVHLS
ncbi:DUF559 domain-containing protein [Candidatus Parcubacteria bacterium]|nr:DUF559 domain-containing protein [Candidatus Parcubacteria bacterium]